MLNVVLYCFISGVVITFIGGVVGLCKSKRYDMLYIIVMSLSGGLMLAVVVFELMLESLVLGGVWVTVVSTVLGILIVVICFDMLNKSRNRLQQVKNSNEYIKVGLIVFVAIGIHNLLEGLVIGTADAVDKSLYLALIISVHNLFEGIAMTLPLVKGGMKKSKALLLCFISGIPTIFGGMIGYWVGGISDTLIATCMSVAGGAMLYITFADVFKSAYQKSKGSSLCTAFAITGLMVGFIICMI